MHLIYCNRQTIPLKCKYCQQTIFFFSCDCGSRILFDELGPPWPIHDCRTPSPTAAPYQPSSVATPSGVSVYRNGRNADGLLPGWQSGNHQIDPALVNRVKESRNITRNTFAIEPIGSTNAEIIGIIRELSRPDLARRHGLKRNDIGYNLLTNIIGDANPIQLTVQVDELPHDPHAIDYYSYTFLSPQNRHPRELTKGAVIRACLTPQETLNGIRFWLAQEIEIIIP